MTIRPSSFALISALAALVGCYSEPEFADDDLEPQQANFALDLSSGRGEGSPGTVITPWPKGSVTYAFEGSPPNLDESSYRAEVAAAFAEWSRVTENRVLFTETADTSDAQILIGFRKGGHEGVGSCRDEFSDPRGTIAHVFTYDRFCMAGVIHLNQDLTWVMNGSNEKGTYDVRYSILHEVGHLLGLGHVNEPGHIMYPEYIGVVRKLTDEEGSDAIAALEGDLNND